MADGEGLLGPGNRKVFIDPMSDNNPITIQVLGICSTLAVTSQLKPSLVMGIAVTFVVAGSNVVISCIRNFIPSRIRMIVEMAVIASLVIFVDLLLKAFMYDVSKQLSVFVGLIITNCIVLGRLEAYAMGNKPWPSFLDGLGNGIGYAMILVIVGFIREFFGQGSIFGWEPPFMKFLYEHGYENNGLMVLAPAAFILLGLIIWAQRTLTGYTED